MYNILKCGYYLEAEEQWYNNTVRGSPCSGGVRSTICHKQYVPN